MLFLFVVVVDDASGAVDVVVVVVTVFASAHRHSPARARKTGSNNSGVEEVIRKKQNRIVYITDAIVYLSVSRGVRYVYGVASFMQLSSPDCKV